MGLLDVLGGMRGGGGFSGGGMFGGGGMSPITGALLGLVAYKAYRSFSANGATSGTGATGAAPTGTNGVSSSAPLGGLLGGIGSMLSAGNGDSILSGGLADLVKQFQQAGHGPAANSWISTGQNRQIAPQDLNNVLTEEQVSFLMQRSGLSREELLAGLAKHLPEAVDQMTPNGRLPNDREAAGLL